MRPCCACPFRAVCSFWGCANPRPLFRGFSDSHPKVTHRARPAYALRKLSEETEDAAFTTVLALLRRPEESSDAYLAMVEESEIRVGLSYYERARISAKAVDQGVFETEKKALLTLFAAGNRAKRSKIRSFLSLMRAFDGQLVFPAALGERPGVKLAKAIDEDPTLAESIQRALMQDNPADAACEQAVLTTALTGPKKILNPNLEADTQSSHWPNTIFRLGPVWRWKPPVRGVISCRVRRWMKGFAPIFWGGFQSALRDRLSILHLKIGPDQALIRANLLRKANRKFFRIWRAAAIAPRPPRGASPQRRHCASPHPPRPA